MPPEESAEAKFDRLKKQLQEAILKDYPNPERKGCPGDAVLQRLATLPLDQPVEEDPHWHHVTHCSPCYQEFLDFNNESRRRAKVVSSRLLWAGALTGIVIAVVVFVALQRRSPSSKRPQNADLAYTKKVVDIPSITRGSSEEPTPIVLKRQRQELDIRLPLGSRAGVYEMQLKNSERTVLSSGGDATIHNGITAFSVKLDLSKITAGHYRIVVRQVPYDWNYYPVEIR